MDNLPVFLSDYSEPAFLVEKGSSRILEANRTAKAGCGSIDPIGEIFDHIVFIDDKTDDALHSYFNHQWFELKSETFSWKDDQYSKITLKRPRSVPNAQTLQTVRNMIAVWLHQLRSPLTGMQGYLEMAREDYEGDRQQRIDKRFDAMDRSIDKLFDFMDELELLHDVASEADKAAAHHLVDAEGLLQDMLSRYPREVHDRILVHHPENHVYFDTQPSLLKRILLILLENALEHDEEEITVDIVSERTIRISNGGAAIPRDIADQLFTPFVTTKANKLGIGLTMAMLYAHRIGGSIFLTDNDDERGVSFTLCLPPLVKQLSRVNLHEMAC